MEGTKSEENRTMKALNKHTSMNILLGHGTHAGIKRDHNEDTYGVSNKNNIYLVADGMGGHDHGEIACALARDTILYFMDKGSTPEQAILNANHEIITNSQERGGDLPMGTTIVLVQLMGDHYQYAWVGDGRIYHFDDNGLHPITTDHSYVQELVEQDLITEDQARSHPHRNVVTQALGVTDNSEINVATGTGEITKGCKVLLCSDGLTEEVDNETIEDILSKNLHPQETCDQLIIAALKAGGSDNITVVVLEFQ